jgi:cell division septal protein FtsQ
MKIVSTGATLASPGFLEKKQKARRKRRIIYSTLLFVLAAGLLIASRVESLRIGNVIVTGASVIPKDDVARAASDLMNEKYLWIIPKNNALVYPQEGIREMLYRKFPRFNSVALSVAGFETLEIGVTEREPFALYCLRNTTPCYFMDEAGFIFDLAPTFSEGVYLTYSEDTGVPEPLGSQFLSPETFKALASFVAHFPTLGLEPISVEKNGESFNLTLDNGVKVLWSNEHDMNRISSNLKSFLSSPEIKAQADFLEKVAELDLRTEDKVFYRFRQ